MDESEMTKLEMELDGSSSTHWQTGFFFFFGEGRLSGQLRNGSTENKRNSRTALVVAIVIVAVDIVAID